MFKGANVIKKSEELTKVVELSEHKITQLESSPIELEEKAKQLYQLMAQTMEKQHWEKESRDALRILMPIIKNIMPDVIANQIVSVQPMSVELSEIEGSTFEDVQNYYEKEIKKFFYIEIPGNVPIEEIYNKFLDNEIEIIKEAVEPKEKLDANH